MNDERGEKKEHKRDEKMTAVLWNKNVRPGSNAPVLDGSFVIDDGTKDGKKYRIALWEIHSKNPAAPCLSGKITPWEDRRKS